MLKKTIKYTDYNGTEREEDFYFNLTEAELMELEMGVNGGYTEMVKQIVASQDSASIMKIFKDLVLNAYGVKSLDGKYFDKSEDVKKRFAQSPAYSVLFMELTMDAKAASDFMTGIIPSKLAEEAKKQAETQGLPGLN